MRINQYRIVLNEEKNTVLKKEKGFNYLCETSFTQPEVFVKLMNDVFDLNKQAEEYVYMLALNAANKPIGVFEISHGTFDQTILNPREVFCRALLCGATKIIICHNHPGGQVEPSKQDTTSTNRIKEAGELIGVPLMDHIIVAGESFLSFRMKGLL